MYLVAIANDPVVAAQLSVIVAQLPLKVTLLLARSDNYRERMQHAAKVCTRDSNM
jgi:hypothetical protein